MALSYRKLDAPLRFVTLRGNSITIAAGTRLLWQAQLYDQGSHPVQKNLSVRMHKEQLRDGEWLQVGRDVQLSMTKHWQSMFEAPGRHRLTFTHVGVPVSTVFDSTHPICHCQIRAEYDLCV